MKFKLFYLHLIRSQLNICMMITGYIEMITGYDDAFTTYTLEYFISG